MSSFEPQLLAEIRRFTGQIPHTIRRLWIAYSGGVDSHALLFAISRLRAHLSEFDIRAIHVDHQLSPLSSQWSEHCGRVCAQLQLAYECRVVAAKAAAGESPEAKARAVRYAAFHSILQAGDCLLTAHHQDDQAETLLLQLLRGAGPRGLAAMPGFAPCGHGYLARPLLAWSREQIEHYARRQGLQWVDDFSNDNPAFDRNFLRLQVIPLLKQRWPALAKTVSRSARLCADTIAIMDGVAADDLQHVMDGDERLSITRLRSLNPERRHNVVRAWLQRLELPCPAQKTLQHLWSQVIDSLPQATPRLQWPGAEIRRFRDHLYAMATTREFDSRQSLPWSMEHGISIAGVGRIDAQAAMGQGLAKSKLRDVHIRFRQGGEKCTLPKRGEHSLKNLFQEMGIVPWMRERIPLIYAGEELAAVGELWICEGFAAAEYEEGLRIVCDYERSIR